jgi:pimeloyl-ACP methyl ester carboxylesterase
MTSRTADFSLATRAWLEAGRHVEIDGQALFVYERGSGPSLVFVHGFPTSGFDWRETIAELASEFHCVSLDLLGFGLSDKPAAWSYSLFQQADLVEALLSELTIESAHVVSHDMGTSLHTELLARSEERRLSFELVGSTFLNGSMIKSMATLTEFQKVLETPSRLPEAMAMVSRMLPGYVAGLKRLMGRPEAVTDEIATVMTEVMQYRDGHLRIPAVYSYVRERYLHMDRWLGALERAAPPIQLVWGVADPVANIEMGRELARRAPQARFIELDGVGHFVPTEAPSEVAAAVRSLAAR